MSELDKWLFWIFTVGFFGTVIAIFIVMDCLTYGGMFKNRFWQTLRKLWGGKPPRQ